MTGVQHDGLFRYAPVGIRLVGAGPGGPMRSLVTNCGALGLLAFSRPSSGVQDRSAYMPSMRTPGSDHPPRAVASDAGSRGFHKR